jgi:hypothetical protein
LVRRDTIRVDTAEIECTRQSLIVSTRAASFRGSRPPPDAVLVTVYLRTVKSHLDDERDFADLTSPDPNSSTY